MTTTMLLNAFHLTPSINPYPGVRAVTRPQPLLCTIEVAIKKCTNEFRLLRSSLEKRGSRLPPHPSATPLPRQETLPSE